MDRIARILGNQTGHILVEIIDILHRKTNAAIAEPKPRGAVVITASPAYFGKFVAR